MCIPVTRSQHKVEMTRVLIAKKETNPIIILTNIPGKGPPELYILVRVLGQSNPSTVAILSDYVGAQVPSCEVPCDSLAGAGGVASCVHVRVQDLGVHGSHGLHLVIKSEAHKVS